MPITGGFGGFTLPRYCDAPRVDQSSPKCSTDPYVIIHDKCRFVDTQTIKLQEAPDMVPVGELPRHMLLAADRTLCGRVVPGSRIIATGVYSTYQSSRSGKAAGAVALRTPYLRVVGLEIDSEGAGGRGTTRIFSAEEEEEFTRMSRTPDLYERFAASIAPSIFGNAGEPHALFSWRSREFLWTLNVYLQRARSDIKKAIACLLFGGSKKVLPDGMRLRGDINVLLLGDPGTAKSQLLKFVEKVRCSCVSKLSVLFHRT